MEFIDDHLEDTAYNTYYRLIERGEIEKIRSSIESGLSLRGRGSDGGTLLHAAVWCNQISIAELLIDMGMVLDDRDFEGNTPFTLSMKLRMIPID
jgi:ankyrin repeat protein